MNSEDAFKRRIEREINARKAAEALLESKSLELYNANEQLRSLNAQLESKVEQRTNQLAKSETRYRNLIEGANEIIFVTNSDGLISFINRVGVEKLKLSVEEIIQHHYTTFIAESHKSAILGQLKDAVRNQAPRVYIEFPTPLRNEHQIWLGQNIEFSYNEDGSMAEALNIARDITQQKEDEQVLLTQGLQLRNLVDNLHSGVLLQSSDRKILQINNYFCDFFKLNSTPEELIGKNLEEILEAVTSHFSIPKEEFQKVSHSSHKVSGQEIKLNDGRYIQFDYVPIYNQEQLLGTLWQFVDVTAQKQLDLKIRNSEEKYRGIIENMELGLLEVDKDGKITRVYEWFSKMIGYSEEELLGKRGEDVFLAPEYIPVLNAEHDKRARGEQSVFEVELIKKNGERIWTIISGAPFYNLKGEIIGSVGIHFDITDQKLLQTEILNAKEVAEQAQEAEQQFLASMSHEIRTPLNAVIGMSHLLYDTNPTNEQKEYLEMIQYSANLLNNLVTDILDFSKIKSGRLELNEIDFDLSAMLNTLHKTFELKAKNKPIQFITHSPELKNLVRGDETMINQVLYNLLGNAEKFTNEGEITLTTELQDGKEGRCEVTFTVKDTGIGISEDKLKDIFEQFRQETRDTQTKYGGTGLGLSISKKIVEFLDGSIEVESTKGVGTTFTVKLPLEVTKKKISTRKVNSTKFDTNKSVLFVEDTVINQNYIQKLLKNEPLDYDMANNGLEALDMCKKKKYDLIFMDISMPVMDGYETTIKLRNSESPNSETPIIALTASALSTKKNKAYDLGMNDYMTKPFTPFELKQRLATWLGEGADEAQQVATKPVATPKPDALLDRETMNMFYDGNLKSQYDMFMLFFNQFDRLKSSLHQFIMNKDYKEAQKIAHQMKPGFTMVGVPVLQTEYQNLEDELRFQNEENINKQWDVIQDLFKKYIPAVEVELRRIEQLI